MASGLTAVTLSSLAAPAHAADVERWCGPGVARPCIVSVKKNGTALDSTSSDVTVSTLDTSAGYPNFTLIVNGQPDVPPSAPLPDVWSVVLDTGASFEPQRIIGINGLDDIDIWTDSTTGHHMVRLTAQAVMWAAGCDSSGAWPWPCPTVATDSYPLLETEIADIDDADDFVGFYAGTNVTFNGIFMEHKADGTPYLSTEAVAPHYQHDGTTLVKGDIRFRVPYRMARNAFGIPDPDTVVPGSFAGTINGSETAGSFAVSQDPDGNGLFIDVTGFTFSLKRVKVARGVIVPTRNLITKTVRATGTRGKVTFTRSKPRGARVTGYQARCVAGSHVVLAGGGFPTIAVTGLHRGHAYDCRTRARSKAGPGPWSAIKRIPARP